MRRTGAAAIYLFCNIVRAASSSLWGEKEEGRRKRRGGKKKTELELDNESPMLSSSTSLDGVSLVF